MLLLILIVPAGFLMAQEPVEETAKETEEVRVVAETETSTSPTNEAVPSEKIRPDGETFESVADILERKSGIHMRRYGGAGSSSNVSIRGSDPDQVQVFLDGIPLNTGYRGEVNLSEYEATGLSSITLLRSTGSGNSAMGGSIEMDSNPGRDMNRVLVGAGSFETAKMSFGLARVFETSSWYTSGSASTSAQNFTYRNDNGTPYLNSLDDYDAKRQNSDYTRTSFRTGGKTRVGNTEIKLLTDFFKGQEGIPGSTSDEALETGLDSRRILTGVKTDSRGVLLDRIRLETMFYGADERRNFYDPQEEFSSGLPDSAIVDRRYGLELTPTLYLPESFQEVSLTLKKDQEEFRKDKRDTNFVFSEMDSDARRDGKFVRLEDRFSFYKDRIKVRIRGEYGEIDHVGKGEEVRTVYEALTTTDESTTYVQDWNFQAGMDLFRTPIWKWNLFAGAGEGTRLPHFFELYGDPGSVRANPDLQPEKSMEKEAGSLMEYKNKGLEAKGRIVVFQRTLDDMILFVPGSRFTLRAENIDRATIRGFESEVEFSYQKRFGGSISYTYQKTRNESEVDYLNGKYLPLRPMHEAHLNGFFRYDFLRFQLDSHYIGAVFQTATNDYFSYQEPTILHNGSVSMDILSEGNRIVRIQVGVKNIMDTRAEDVDGYPLPGRGYYLSLMTEF